MLFSNSNCKNASLLIENKNRVAPKNLASRSNFALTICALIKAEVSSG